LLFLVRDGDRREEIPARTARACRDRPRRTEGELWPPRRDPASCPAPATPLPSRPRRSTRESR